MQVTSSLLECKNADICNEDSKRMNTTIYCSFKASTPSSCSNIFVCQQLMELHVLRVNFEKFY